MKVKRKGFDTAPDGARYRHIDLRFTSMRDEAAFLRKLVDEYAVNLAVKKAAVDAIRAEGAPAKDGYAQAIAIAAWVQKNIFYVHEARELFQLPTTTLKLKSGDCDDFTVLIAAMCESCGIKTKLAILKLNGRWAHIFPCAIVKLDGEVHRIPLDATLTREDYPVEDVTSPVAIAQRRGDTVDLLLA